jgi:hypothetical protein
MRSNNGLCAIHNPMRRVDEVHAPWRAAGDHESSLGSGRPVHGKRPRGGSGQVKNWSRLFLSPGMGHCSGGSAALDNFDLLSALMDWVEKGTAPDSVKATGRAFPDRSRPLCVFPAHAQYKGQGNPEDAANFECK